MIRHGETEGSETRRYKGTIDVPLSEKGIKQIKRLVKYMVQDSSNPHSSPFFKGGMGGLLSAVYCSDLSRAIKSAEIIAEPYSLKPIIVPSLRERNFGIWEGMSFEEIRERYPDEFEAWVSDPLKFSPVKGESTIEVRNRVIDALNKILDNHVDQGGESDVNNIAIVAHGGVNRVILCYLLDIPMENIFRIEQDYAAVNIIEFRKGYPVVKLINGAVND